MVPAELGFRMPAEWEPHEATWIAWPHHRDDWPGKFEAIPWVYAEIVRLLHRSETVRILVDDKYLETEAGDILKRADVDLARIEFIRIPTDRVWTRDFGPTFLKNEKGEQALLDWSFNAWAKYDNWQRDDAVPAKIAAKLKMRSWQPTFNGNPVILEGGSIDVSGQGLLLTTEECMLGDVQKRNPGMERHDLEKIFADYLGIRKTLWLGRGIAGDDTHGHIDDLARFVAPNVIVVAVEDDPKDENYEPLKENLNRLKAMTDLDGKPFWIVPLPMPAPVMFDGQRLPASYANFYIANRYILVPTFNDVADRQVMNILADLFPDRAVVGIHAVDLVWGLGTLHCMTQQQ